MNALPPAEPIPMRRCQQCLGPVTTSRNSLYCVPCQDARRLETMTCLAPMIAGPALACCGGWVAITQFPLVTPCCARTYLVPESEALCSSSC